jgi:amino acid adenylation domain-containing protein
VSNRRSAPVVARQGLHSPCSPEQRRLWILHQLDPNSAALNISVRWRVDGRSDAPELEQAFRLLIARHQAMRTGIADIDGEPVQITEPQVAFHIPVIDLTALPRTEALVEAERLARLDACTPFSLEAPPLLRVTQLRMAGNASVLAVTAHHVVSDLWSMRILERELAEILAAASVGRQVSLPEQALGYGAAQRQQVERQIATSRKDLDFWTRSLQGAARLELPTDRARPPMLTANGRARSIMLDSDLSEGLESLAGHEGGAAGVIVLAALFALSGRYTGESDIVIGSQVSGRDQPGFGGLVGLFRHFLLLRVDLSDDPGFVVLLQRTRDSLAAGLAHQCIAVDALIGIVRPERDLSRHPMCSVIVTQQPASGESEHSARFGLKEIPAHEVATLSDLHFLIGTGTSGWRIACEFNVDLFDSHTVERMLAHLQALLRAAVTNPTGRISTLEILDAAERSALLLDGNRTDVAYPRHSTLVQLIQAQAGCRAEAVAVLCAERSMSYRELDDASNRLARELGRRGVVPGSQVAILLDRSPELLVALLAVLKSGSAYIPLDPAYPAERLRHVFENSRPAAIITRAALRERLLPLTTDTVLLDSESLLIAAQSAAPLPLAASADDPAYVIYTSGSTGRPKGVIVHHRALVNLLCAMRAKPGMSSEDTVVSVTTISFDIAALDMFLPLIVGARLVIATEQEMSDGAALLWLLRRHSATFLQATPATWQLLLEAGWQGRPSLKMLCGGEAMSRRLADRLLDCGGELWNMYGPTETTVWSSAFRVEPGNGRVAIGPPIANTQFYILDRNEQLVPRGVPGELFIGGDGVALGYLALPEETRKRFVVDGFRGVPGSRLYRTGDVVRMTPRGNMEYLGRTDHQVKLRGYRIELGDIEAALLQHPDVAEAVVVLGSGPPEGGAIRAYVVPHRTQVNAGVVLIGALRTSLAQTLPAYMRPASIALLTVLPRTPNGKLDRRALPQPAQLQLHRLDAVQPLNEVELRLQRIWMSVLGLTVVDKGADFFDLGGHSLLAARLLTRVEAEFGVRLSLLTLFNAPTVGEQARLLMQDSQREYDFRQVVRLQPGGSKSPLIAIHNTGVYYYNLSKRLGPDQPLTALQLFDPVIAREDLPTTLEEVAGEYVQLVRRFQATGPYKLIGWCVGGVLAFEVARQLVAAGSEVSLLAMIDAWAPGHKGRLSWVRSVLADYSYRGQLIGADWRRVTSGRQSLLAFIAQRAISKRLLGWLGHSAGDAPAPITFATRSASAENYDQWLLGYLDQVARNYHPEAYVGRVLLLCSAREPKGMFLDPKMGWAALALGGVEVAVIDGDHFTMLQGEGLEQMALHIAAASEANAGGNSRPDA